MSFLSIYGYDESDELAAIAENSPIAAYVMPLGQRELEPVVGIRNSVGLPLTFDWIYRDRSVCDVCHGDGVLVCEHCHHERDCDACDGEGDIELQRVACSTNTYGEVIEIHHECPPDIRSRLELLIEARVIPLARWTA